MDSELQKFYIGIDLGTSFIKVALININIEQSQKIVDIIREPQTEMQIISQKQNYSQQDPQLWWKNTSSALKKIMLKHPNIKIQGIGISYQMHGLILIDKNGKVLRNSIIWTDGRTKKVGHQLQNLISQNQYHKRSMNNPGHFTLSKLKWVQQNQPQIFQKIHKFMLPGDYIAFKLTGECLISQSGLSQGVMWDFQNKRPFFQLLQKAKIPRDIMPKVVKSFSFQGKVTKQANYQTHLPQNCPIFYRSGDQANNAFSLGVLLPGQIAAAGGTSGTIWFVTNSFQSLQLTRINTFLHVNHSQKQPNYGKLLCINGCGKVYSWIKHNFFKQKTYDQLNQIAYNCQSDGILVIPFGNGPQRMLNNYKINFNIKKMDLNRHTSNNIIRATVESIAFSFIYGIKILKSSETQQLTINTIKTASDNLFKCQIICEIIATLLDCSFQIYETTGAVGCALGAKIGHKAYQQKSQINLFQIKKLPKLKQIKSKQEKKKQYKKLYDEWQKELNFQMLLIRKIKLYPHNDIINLKLKKLKIKLQYVIIKEQI